MPESDLALLTEAALAAGTIATRHFRSSPARWDKGAGQGPVSEADLEIDAMLRERLLAARPGHGWLSEETPDAAARLNAREVFIVDPIDGTRAFLNGQKGFAHALAIARDGAVVAGVVHLPLMGLTYTALRGRGATLNGRRLAVSEGTVLEGARVLAGKPQLAAELWPGGVPPVEPHLRPSLAWRLCLVGEGRFDGMVTLRDAWHWDTAAASLVAQEAGAMVTDRDGAPLLFNTADPVSAGVMAGPAALHEGLMARLTGAPAE